MINFLIVISAMFIYLYISETFYTPSYKLFSAIFNYISIISIFESKILEILIYK